MPQSRHPSLRHSDGPALAVIVAAIVCVGAGLRLWQYLANASLWVDEAAVARNVVDRSVAGLFAPLDYGQAAPWGFLLIEKLAVALFGNHEYALRLFPLLCGLASLVLFYVVARQILTGVGVPVALTMFAIGIPFVYFPSQVKPYSCDIAAALLVAALALRLWRTRPPLHTALWFGAIGAAIPFVSYSSVFPLAGIGAAMVVLAWHDRRPLPPVLAAVGLWCAGVVLAIGAARGSMTAADREFMQRYWAAGFAPAPHSLQDWLWPWHQITAAFGVFSKAPPTLDGGLHYRYPLLCAALCLAGAWSLLRRGRHLAAFVFAPAALAFIAAAAHAYPISGRLAVFLIPFLAIAVAAAIEDLHDAARPRVGYAALLAPTFVIVLAVHAIARTLPPDRQEDVKSVLSYVRDHRRPDDAVYVYYGAGQAVRYYGSRYGFTADEYVSGSCARDDPRVYLREIDRFRGRPRAWAIFSHSLQDGREIRLMTGYLDRIGRRLDASPAQSGPLGAGAYAFLYDLTDANKLASASAESFSVPRADRETAWLCYGTMTPVRFVRTPNLEPRTSNLEPRTMNAEP